MLRRWFPFHVPPGTQGFSWLGRKESRWHVTLVNELLSRDLSMKCSVGVPIGSMGLVYFTYMCHKKSTKCRQIYQSHGCYGVVWLVAWCVLATLKLNFTPPQKQDTHPKKSHIVLKSTQFSVGRLFGAKKIGADANDPNNPRDIWVCALVKPREHSKKTVKIPLTCGVFWGVS